MREAEAGGSRLKFIFVSPFRRDTSSDLRATKGIRKVARGIGHGRHVGRQKQHRRNHLLCGLIEAVREEMGDEIPVRWTVAMAAGVAYNICS